MQNSTSGPYVAPVFSPPPYAVAVNALFFASLGIVLIAAFLCMLIKGWIRELDRKLRGIPDLEKRAVIKELREQGLARWRLPEMITILPSLIHISLVLFFIGLALYLLQVHPLPAFLSISIFGLGMLVYFLSIIISAIDDFSPFRSMYSRALGVLYRHLYPRPITLFVSSSVMALPQTTVKKIRERVSTFIIKYKPLSERAILEPPSSSVEQISLRQIIANTSITVFNKIWTPVSKRKTSTDAKNISTSILLQLDVTHLRPSRHTEFPLPYETSKLSIKEVESLAYSVCMMTPTTASEHFVRVMRAVIEVLQQSSDPWPHLVASLTSVWVECAERKLVERTHIDRVRLGKLSIAGRKEDILHAISNVRLFSAEQWCFVLSSIHAFFIQAGLALDSEEIRALTEILARLLQMGMCHKQDLIHCPNPHTDFWLCITMSILDIETVYHRHTLMPSLESGEILHARDISEYGSGMTRDPENFRRLLQLSQEHNLDQSLMRQCLISILYILISFEPSDQQQIRLVNQYIEIIKEDMDVIEWSLHLSGLLTNENIETSFLSQMVCCLLKGTWLDSLDRHDHDKAACITMQEYDLKLSAANAQATPSIMKVMDRVIKSWTEWKIRQFWIGEDDELQNPWLSLYTCNLTPSLFRSNVPLMWYPGCTSIASKRLDLYDSRKVKPELGLIITFLTYPSASIACRALHWYCRLKEHAITNGDIQYLPTTFPIIFRKGLSTDENRMTWLLLVDVLLPSLDGMPQEEKGYFVENFFGYGSSRDRSTISSRAGDGDIPGQVGMPTETSTLQANGLGWMEDVWATVLRPLIIHIDRPETYSPELLQVLDVMYRESGQLREATPSTPLSPRVARNEASDGTVCENGAIIGPQTLEEHLGDSARRVLEVLAQLLESGTGLMPAELLARVGNSPLLSDKRLHNDTGSLRRIRVILDQGV